MQQIERMFNIPNPAVVRNSEEHGPNQALGLFLCGALSMRVIQTPKGASVWKTELARGPSLPLSYWH